MENLIEVLKKFLPLIHVPPIIQNKIEILNLTALKTQIPINYLTLRKKKKKKKKLVPVLLYVPGHHIHRHTNL
jgi:hypothetical protein